MSDQPPFRFTPQVGIVIAIVILALAIPLTLVGLYFRNSPEQPTGDPPDLSAALAPMEENLEMLVDARLAGDGLNFDQDSTIRIDPEPDETLQQCVERMLSAVDSSKGTALETTVEVDGISSNWIVTIPVSNVGNFRRSLQGKDIAEPPTQPSKSGGEGTTIFRLEIARPNPAP